MAPTCPTAEGIANAAIAPANAMLVRSRSGHSMCPMPHTACATTATATIFSPSSHAACATPPPSAKP